MKALVWDGGPYPEGFRIKDVEKKSPGKNWVSIRTKLCAKNSSKWAGKEK